MGGLGKTIARLTQIWWLAPFLMQLSRRAACGLPTRFPIDDPLEQFAPKTLSFAEGFLFGWNRVCR